MPEFKTVPIKPMTGLFDTLSSADEIGFGNWRVVKNATTRATRNRQRGGGWRRLFADDFPYNNQDLHDQLTDQLGYFEEFSAHAMGGGGLSGYGFTYFVPSYTVDGGVTVGPQSGPYCPVYVGDFQSGIYNGCSISDAFVGYPFRQVASSVNTTFLRSHWRMDEPTGNSDRVDAVGGIDLTAAGSPVSVPGQFNGAAEGTTIAQSLSSVHVDLRGADIKFGFTGCLQFNNVTSGNIVLGVWNTVGGQASYKVFLVGSSLSFEVSSNGAIVPPHRITSPRVLVAGQKYFFAVWHDSVANTINVKINADTTTSASYSLGVFAGAEPFLALRGVAGGFGTAPMDGWLDWVSFWRGGFPSEPELAALYNGGDFDDYPFASGEACNTGYPDYFAYSHLYTQCTFNNPDFEYGGYGYGPQFPIYDPAFSYDYTYCGPYMFSLQGCREAVTMLQEVVTSNGRKLIASTMSRLYELNQSAGNWRILADGLGNSGYTINQCGCNKVRGVSATLGSYLIYTNNFDPPLIYILGDDSSGCGLQAAQPITDLVALGITKAGGVVTWKGFTIFYDFTEDGVRMGGSVIWSDLEDPNSYIESDTSFAGRATIAVGETILAAAPLGNWLIFYTDKSIIRVTLVGGEDVFNFERIYQGGNALKYKFSLINCGDQHMYLGESDVYAFTQFDTRPVTIAWITKASGMIFKGISESEARYDPINKDACDLVTGGWSEEKHEAWLSWPTGQSICPDVTLRFNLKFNAADFVDHGFTAMMTFRADDRPTVGQWIEDMGICPRGSQVATGVKDGSALGGSWSLGSIGSGSCLEFLMATDAHVLVPDSPSLQITTALTIEAWINAVSASSAGIFEKTIGGTIGTSYLFFLEAGLLKFRLNGVTTETIVSDAAFPLNVLTHVAATWDGTTLKLFIDGVQQVQTASLLAPLDTGAGDSFIGHLGTGLYPFTGHIDEVRIWNLARTQAEILAWKNLPLVGNEAGLAAYWRLDEGAGLLALDSTGHGNAGTLTNGPVWDNCETFPAIAPVFSNPACIDELVVANPPLYIRNPEEDPNLPVHPDSLCSRLIGLTMEDFCQDCASESTFITASATDFTLKQQEDDVYYRQMLGGSPGDYDAYSCQGEFYTNEGYVTAMQTGSQDFRTTDEKIVKMLGLEAEPVVQAVPLRLQMEVGYASQPECMTWFAIRSLPFECLSEKTAAQHLADRTRPDSNFYFPTFRRGIYLGARFRINGIGGAGTFSSLFQMIKGWGQQDSP